MLNRLRHILPLFLFSVTARAQQDAKMCRTSELMKEYYDANPAALQEHRDFESYTQQQSQQHAHQKTTATIKYVIPVVFHVYDSVQGGKKVNEATIISAIDKLNEDFHGLNADYNTVHNQFLAVRGNMPDIVFALAKKDPSGNPTNGITYHAQKSGYGNGSGYDTQIAADAWDNFKYMNIYIMYDLYNNGVYNNSGVAWYPSTSMSTANTARIVYNGVYLGKNSAEVEFASTLTHEFGHWLNLIHTFEGGCVAPNDNVADTPPCDYNTQVYGCHSSATANTPLNCNNNLINAENYMDYSGSHACYKMFTQGQVARMYTALEHPSRKPLWQTSNLIATGVDDKLTTGFASIQNSKTFITVSPNPSAGIFTINTHNSSITATVEIFNTVGQRIYTTQISSNNKTINIQSAPAGIYYAVIKTNNSTTTVKLQKTE